MTVHTLAGIGPYDNNVYVIEDGGEALVVDASASVADLTPVVDGLRLTGLAITHRHADHTVHVRDIADEFGCPVYWGFSARPGITPFTDGATLRAGSLQIAVLHTPGHTEDSACFVTGGDLISGDTLFPGGPGNTNSDPALFAQIMASLDRLFATYPDEMRVLPGHGAGTTLGTERPHLPEWRARGW